MLSRPLAIAAAAFLAVLPLPGAPGAAEAVAQTEPAVHPQEALLFGLGLVGLAALVRLLSGPGDGQEP